MVYGRFEGQQTVDLRELRLKIQEEYERKEPKEHQNDNQEDVQKEDEGE